MNPEIVPQLQVEGFHRPSHVDPHHLHTGRKRGGGARGGYGEGGGEGGDGGGERVGAGFESGSRTCLAGRHAVMRTPSLLGDEDRITVVWDRDELARGPSRRRAQPPRMKSATARKSSMRCEKCCINGPLAPTTRALRSCHVGEMCARNLAPLHRRRGPHPIRSHAGAGHLISMRSSCLGYMDGIGRVSFPHLHDTLTPGQPEGHTLRKPDLVVGEEGSRWSIACALHLRVIAG